MNIAARVANARVGRWIARMGKTDRRTHNRGSVAIFCAALIPVMIVFGAMATDTSYVYYRNQLLQRTAQAAAQAAKTSLSAYYAAGGTYSTASMATINTAVATVVAASMPSASYGNVVPTTTSNATSAIQLGTWNTATKTFTATTTSPNAVKVNAFSTAANGNAVQTFFRSMIGLPTVDISVTAIASYGNGLSGAGGFNTIILNDLSMSFSSAIPNQRAVDVAILDCVAAGTNGNAKIGLTGFTGHSKTVYALTQATTANIATMKTYINGTLNYCGNTGMPACSGSNVASGLYSAIAQLQAAGIANSTSNIVIVTDGVPNADAFTYVTADGTSTTPLATPAGWAGCTTSCSDANLWSAAQAQALYAKSLGINVSTVYYSGSTSGASNVTAYSTKLASLVSGNGISLVAPTMTTVSSAFATFCSSMGSALKYVQ